MERSQIRQALLPSFALLLTLAAVSKPLAEASRIDSVLAQSDALPVPTAVTSGTMVKIDGSSSMIATNQAFKQRFEKNFPSREVQVEYDGTNAALQSVLQGKTDLAAVGRFLTEEVRPDVDNNHNQRKSDRR